MHDFIYWQLFSIYYYISYLAPERRACVRLYHDSLNTSG